jgi:mannose-6-phosphate isomerase class I
MIDYTGTDAGQALTRARQRPQVLRTSHGSREVRLFNDDVLPYFDATALEVAGEIEVADGRFGVAIVAAGDGAIEGDFGSQPIRRGETYALPASLPFRIRAAASTAEPLRVIRCMGPAVR